MSFHHLGKQHQKEPKYAFWPKTGIKMAKIDTAQRLKCKISIRKYYFITIEEYQEVL